MTDDQPYDCAIIGGGVAGLSLAMLLAGKQYKVILFEKENYPFHKVCGEYISLESMPFLQALGLDFKEDHLPQMDRLLLSSPSGITVERLLDIGGTGLSRYELDNRLYRLAVQAGVTVMTQTKVVHINFEEDVHVISTGQAVFRARTCAGAYGKNTNIDHQLGRDYKNRNNKDFFIAVKHHVEVPFDRGRVELHNFPGGYCGMSSIEEGKTNMSYISRASNLTAQGSIAAMERNVLSVNPFLKKYFEQGKFLYAKPLTISHLYFGIKETVSHHMLMLGDAAGNIAPLSGNGMSMAMQSAKIAAGSVSTYLEGVCTLKEMEAAYEKQYQQAFSRRIRSARFINHTLGHPHITNFSFRILKLFPGIVDHLARQIHGKVY